MTQRPSEVKISLFRNAHHVDNPGEITVHELLDGVRTGKWARQIKALRQCAPDQYDELKRALPCVSLSTLLKSRRKEIPIEERIIAHSGLLQVDLDKVPDLDGLRTRLQQDEYVFFCFLSPGGQGLKVGVPIDGTRHMESFKSAERYFLATYGATIDPSVKDPGRLMFVSHDPDLFVNEEALPLPTDAAMNDVLKTAVRMIQEAPEGTKHDVLLKAARLAGGAVANGTLDIEEARRALREAIQGKPGVKDLRSAYQAIEDGLAHGIKAPLPDDGAEPQGPEWEDPVPFDVFNAPRIETSIIPTWGGRYAQAISESIQIPQELAIANVLGVVATAVARKFMVEVKPGYREPLNLYLICPLEPGERKSTTVATCTFPLVEWEEDQARELSESVRAARSELKTAEKVIESKRLKAARAATLEARKQIITEIQELEKNTPRVPTIPRLLGDDITPERAATIMAENDHRIGFILAEGGLFDILAGRYSNNVPNLDLFLKGHSGDSVRVDRQSGTPVYMPNPSITMAMCPQNIVLRELASKPGFRGRGFLGRFLYFMPQTRLGFRTMDAPPVDPDISDTYSGKVRALLSIPWNTNLYGEKVPYILGVTHEALAQWREFAGMVETQLRDGGQFEAMRDWAGKLPGAAVRLAGIFHLIRYAGVSIPDAVGEEDMEGALELSTLLTEHARCAFGLMGASPDVETARHILNWIVREGVETFTQRDCYRALRGRYPQVSQLVPGLILLTEAGYAIRLKDDQEKRGRPRGPMYRVNPKVLEKS